jgi:hypothetical protein
MARRRRRLRCGTTPASRAGPRAGGKEVDHGFGRGPERPPCGRPRPDRAERWWHGTRSYRSRGHRGLEIASLGVKGGLASVDAGAAPAARGAARLPGHPAGEPHLRARSDAGSRSSPRGSGHGLDAMIVPFMVVCRRQGVREVAVIWGGSRDCTLAMALPGIPASSATARSGPG